MGVYQKLGELLAARQGDEWPVGFRELEALMGVALPSSAFRYAGWWSNNPSNNSMTSVWLKSGWRTEKVDVAEQTVVFRRAGRGPALETKSAGSPAGQRPGGRAGPEHRLSDPGFADRPYEIAARLSNDGFAERPAPHRSAHPQAASRATERDLLFDTDALLGFAGAGAVLAADARAEIGKRLAAGGALFASPFSALVIGEKVAAGDLKLTQRPEAWFAALPGRCGVAIADLPPSALIAAASLPGAPPADLAERVMAATAREFGYVLLTRSAALIAYAADGHIEAVAC